jgi:M6 family metalloprotease-like protein
MSEGEVVATYSLANMGIVVVNNAFGLASNGTHLIGHSSPVYNNPTTPYYFIRIADMTVVGSFLGPDRYDTPHGGQPGNTHDLAYGDGCIWAVFDGTYDDLIWKVEPWTGVILDVIPSPRSDGSVDSAYPQGLAYDGEFLWLSESKKGNPQIMIYKINPNTKTVADSFVFFNQYPGDTTPGLAYGSGYLWIANMTKILKVDPATHSVVSSFSNPANNNYYYQDFAHIEFDGTYLWVADDHNLYKVSTAAQEEPDLNVAVIFVDFSDNNPAPSKSMETFEDIREDVISYYDEVSYGSDSFDIRFYPDDGSWLQLPRDLNTYLQMNKGHDQFIIDGISAADTSGLVDFSKCDYDPANGIGIPMFVHPGYSHQHTQMPPYIVPDNLLTVLIHRTGPSGYFPTSVGAFVDGIIMSEEDNVGAWTHEIGHFLGKALVTSKQGTAKDGGYWVLPDRRDQGRGDIGAWGLMGTGSWLPFIGGLLPTQTCPDHMCSYSKEWLGWLRYKEYQHPAFGAYWIDSLVTMDYGDEVFKYKINDDLYYILEVRNRNSAYSKWDVEAPFDGILSFYDSSELIYKVESKEGGWIVNIASKIVLSSIPYLDEYSDAANGVMFEVVGEGGAYEMRTEIKAPAISGKIGAVLDSKARLMSLISPGTPSMPELFGGSFPDLDLHAYSEDGKHVGMNYSSGKYELEIQGAFASDDLCNGQEWIFVPDDLTVHFAVTSKDNLDFFDSNPEYRQVSEGIELFDLRLVYYDSIGNRWESTPITERIGLGETIWHVPGLTENPDGTYSPKVSPIVWNHIFQDSTRKTALKIDTEKRCFQFIAQDKEFLPKCDQGMKLSRNVLMINYQDTDIRLIATAVTGRHDFCVAIAWDKQTHKKYLLVDHEG